MAVVLHICRVCITLETMKTLTVRLPEALAAEIEAESRERHRSKSDIVRERLSAGTRTQSKSALPAIIADVVGAIDGLPLASSRRKKAYLKKGYGRNRNR
jgi:Arc/MetJ-type ribon-helix-helix transcriptional regulator